MPPQHLVYNDLVSLEPMLDAEYVGEGWYHTITGWFLIARQRSFGNTAGGFDVWQWPARGPDPRERLGALLTMPSHECR